MKNLIIQRKNNENHEIPRTPFQNLENQTNSSISHQNH